jgi:hypothetical protein
MTTEEFHEWLDRSHRVYIATLYDIFDAPYLYFGA